MIRNTLSASRLALVVATAALGLSACNQALPTVPASGVATGGVASGEPVTAAPIAALPLATATPVAAPSAPATLPPARAIKVAPRPRTERYRYVDRAAEYNRGFADTPPDYTVDYQGTRPWVWRANNGAYRVVEQLPQGTRDYYYAAGSDQPFYVSDPQGGYAYDNGDLVGVYGPDGQTLDAAYTAQRAAAAAAYYDRARALYRAAQYDRRQAAYAADWQARRADQAARQAAYDDARTRDAEWQAWHDQHRADEDRHWADERNRRLAYAAAIGAVGMAAVVATRGHDDRGYNGGGGYPGGLGGNNGGGYARNDPRNQPQGVPAGQVALIQQQAALDGQRRQAAIDAQRTAADRQAADLAATPTAPIAAA